MAVMSVSVESAQYKAELAMSFRIPRKVTEIRMFKNGEAFPVCPACRVTLEREYQSYCDRCGQALDWKGFRHAIVVLQNC